MKKIITAIGIIAMQMCWAQDEDFLPKIVPSSPQATELGRYGNVPVGMFTGSPNVNLNIYTLEEAGISIPVNMTYTSNGVQVDGVAKQLGIDWNLITGGVISRQINDLDDLQFPFYTVNAIDLCEPNSPEAATIASATVDTEKDIFSFNFLGNSGKFYFDGNNIIQITPSNIKIERLAAPNNATPKFKITDTNGTEYYFGGTNAVEQSWNRSHCGGVVPPSLDDTAWYLTKIKTVQGQEAILTYAEESFQYIQSYYQTAVSTGNFSLSTASLQTPCYNELRHEVPFLQEIIINDKKIKFNYQKIDTNSSESKQLISMEVYNTTSNMLKKFTFNYDIFTLPSVYSNWRNSYTNADEKHIFLKNVEELAPAINEKITRYSFDYYSPELIPPRHSFAKDIYGYFNGAFNTNIISNNIPVNTSNMFYNAFKNVGSNRSPNLAYTGNGMLKNIYYPTKGRTEFIYEPNSIVKDKLITPGPTGIASFAVSETVGYNSEHYSDPFTVPNNVIATLSAVAWRDCGEDDPVHPPQVLAYVINASTGSIIKSLFANETPADTTVPLEPGITYKIKLKVSRPCLGANANLVGPAAPPYTIKVNEPVGGVRVSKTLDYDNNGNIQIKKYYYGTLDNLEMSSGILSTIDPSVVWNIDEFERPGQTNIYTMYSSPKTSLFSLDGYSIMYPSVIESFGENFEKGGVHHKFKANQEILPLADCGGMIRGVAFTNSFLTGAETGKYALRKNGNNFVILSAEESYYSQNSSFDHSIENYLSRLISYKPSESSGGSGGGTGSGGDPAISLYAVNRYFLRSQFHFLFSKRSTIYDLNGQNPVKTETQYFYNNPSHYQLTAEKTIHPDNTSSESSSNEKTYSYAYEKGNQLLIDKNMVGIPLETVTTQTNGSTTKTLSKTETKYPTSLPTAETGSLVLPMSVLSYDIPNNTTDTEVKYDKYDVKGNLLQYTTKAGVPVAIVWGYNQTQPIAKVEGATYDQLANSGLISAIVSASDNDASDSSTEGAFRDALDSFRNNPGLSGYQITTITYNPLIGVTSMTPPSGIREVYIYDSFNRLKEIRENDATGNILKEFNYNYKP